jgi:hypothetical protein
MGWAHNFKPAKGAGKGDGWGGPARGAGQGGPARRFTARSATRHAGAGDPAKVAARAARSAAEQARVERLIAQIGDLALNAEREETRVSATVAALNRLEGMPRQRNETANFDAGPGLEELLLAAQNPPATS